MDVVFPHQFDIHCSLWLMIMTTQYSQCGVLAQTGGFKLLLRCVRNSGIPTHPLPLTHSRSTTIRKRAKQ